MGEWFRSETVVNHLGLAATKSCPSIYQHLFMQALQRNPALEIVVFKPREFKTVDEARAFFMTNAQEATMIFHHYVLFRDIRDFCPDRGLFDEMRVFADHQVNDNPDLRSKAEAVVSHDERYETLTAFDKAFCTKVCLEHGIPTPRHYTMDEMREKFESGADIPLPLVFKDTYGCNGNGVFFIEKKEQLAIIFDKDKIAAARAKYPAIDFDHMSFTFEDFIKTPSDYYSKYRIVFLGHGAIHVNSTLKYSDRKKGDDKIELPPLAEKDAARIYHEPDSPLYLASVQKQAHGTVIPCLVALEPLIDPVKRTALDDVVLRDHGIDPAHIAVPEELMALAKRTAAAFATKGLIGLQGHDWLQDRAGKFYLIENNLTPASPSFRATRNGGRGGVFEGLSIKAAAAAEAIFATLKDRR